MEEEIPKKKNKNYEECSACGGVGRDIRNAYKFRSEYLKIISGNLFYLKN